VTSPTDDPFELPFGGLDLRRQDEVTFEEHQASGEFYVARFGHRHRGLQWMLEERPDALKRFRRFVRVAYSAPGAPVTDGLAGDDVPEQAFATGFLSYYVFTGYQVGVRYVVRTLQRAGQTKEQVLDALAIAFLNGGPAGAETIQLALDDYAWIVPSGPPPKVPAEWDPSHDALRSGLDFTDPHLSPAELRSLEQWYADLTGEVPEVIRTMGRHRPDVLKAWRNRYENCLKVLPKQALPLTLLQMDVFLGRKAGIREHALVAKGFGVTREQLLRAVSIGLEYGTLSAMATMSEAIGDVLDTWED
jgi:alkylhydroperoxidase/carboxymuconolactone decarboxylase family protein YurZ